MTTETTSIIQYERAFGPFVHMAAGDKVVWIRWLALGGAMHAPFEYDLRVGHGLRMPPNSSVITLRIAHALTTKRIDVVCNIYGVLTVIEVKQRAGLSAIGQLIGYRELLLATQPPGTPINMLLVTGALEPDMRSLLSLNQIDYSVVGGVE